jgi:hypothetical protein
VYYFFVVTAPSLLERAGERKKVLAQANKPNFEKGIRTREVRG